MATFRVTAVAEERPGLTGLDELRNRVMTIELSVTIDLAEARGRLALADGRWDDAIKEFADVVAGREMAASTSSSQSPKYPRPRSSDSCRHSQKSTSRRWRLFSESNSLLGRRCTSRRSSCALNLNAPTIGTGKILHFSQKPVQARVQRSVGQHTRSSCAGTFCRIYKPSSV
jgi:hypothetical protein